MDINFCASRENFNDFLSTTIGADSLCWLSAGYCNRAVRKGDRPLDMPHNSSDDLGWSARLGVKPEGVGLNNKTVVADKARKCRLQHSANSDLISGRGEG